MMTALFHSLRRRNPGGLSRPILHICCANLTQRKYLRNKGLRTKLRGRLIALAGTSDHIIEAKSRNHHKLLFFSQLNREYQRPVIGYSGPFTEIEACRPTLRRHL